MVLPTTCCRVQGYEVIFEGNGLNSDIREGNLTRIGENNLFGKNVADLFTERHKEEPMTQQALYTSTCAAKSLWQEYRIYDDRVELDTLLGTLTVPLDQVEGVEVAHSFLQGLRLHLRGLRPAIKLDWADLHEHVVIDKNTGLFRHVAFTPDNPEKFAAALEQALAQFRQLA